MLVTLSDRHIANVIRQFENLPPEFTSAEMGESPHFFARFRQHLAEAYGVQFTGEQSINPQTGIGQFRVNLITDNIESIAEGLQVLAPLNVSIERDDLVPLGAPLAVGHWQQIAPYLQKLSLPVANLLDKINDAVGSLLPGPPSLDAQTYAEWSIENNVRLPGARASELRRLRFEREAEARRQADEERLTRNHESSFRIQDPETKSWY